MICEAWEGLTVDGKFPLLERLHGGTDRCLFLTVRQGINTAAIRLVVAAGADQDQYLAAWEGAKRLSHPSLVQLMESGRSEVRGSDVVYVVMEKTDTFLSAIIPNKALTSARARALLDPIVGALSFIHEQGLAHGSVKPSNIVQVGEQWKLALDEMAGAGDHATRLDTYDAPEVGSGLPTTAADVWSLGIIAIEAFAQKTPMWNRGVKGDLGVPGWLPEPFREIALGCLRWEREERLSIEDIKTLLARSPIPREKREQQSTSELRGAESGLAAVTAAVEPVSAKVESKVEAKREERKAVATPAPVEQEHEDYEEDEEYENDEYEEDEEADELTPRSRRLAALGEERKGFGWLLLVGIVAFVAVAIVVAPRGYWTDLWQSARTKIAQQIAPQASQPSPQSQTPANETASGKAPPSPEQAEPPKQPEVVPPESENATPGETPAQDQQPSKSQTVPAPGQPLPETHPPAVPSTPAPAAESKDKEQKSETKAQAPQPANARGAVAKRILPSVAPGARQSMRRPVDVELRVFVNERGTVSNTTYLTQSPGNYYARISHQAAEEWKFQPPVTDGESRTSEWLLRFRFDRTHVEVTATQVR